MYKYKAYVASVYDGDTITCEVDLGFSIKVTKKIRLYGINTPEVRGEEKIMGKKVRDYLRSLILHKDIVLETVKDKTGKYGRYLATVHYNDMNINKHLLEIGYAKEYMS